MHLTGFLIVCLRVVLCIFFFSIPNYFERSFCPDFEAIRIDYVFFLHFFVDMLQQDSGLLFISSHFYFVHARQHEVFERSKECET